MGAHDPTRCQVCNLHAASRDATAEALGRHFRRHHFHLTSQVQTPGEWVWQWMRTDPQMWMASMSPRGHVEKRLRQIEQLAGVDDFIRDPEARIWLDVAFRAWKEGLNRTMEFKARSCWELGDEMPTREDMLLIDRRLQSSACDEDRVGVVGALQDRFCYAAPCTRQRLVQLLCVSWGWLPDPGDTTGFLAGNDERMGHLGAVWQCNAIRMVHDQLASFTPEQRRPLLGWMAAALLPGAFQSARYAEPEIYRLLADEEHWPEDPRLAWLARAWAKHPGSIASRLSQVALENATPGPLPTAEAIFRRL